MPTDSAPRTCRWLKWWLAGAVLLLLVSFAMTSVLNPNPVMAEDNTPIPFSGWECLLTAIGMAFAFPPTILFTLPTLWIPLSFLFAGCSKSRARLGLTLSTTCFFLEICAAVFVRQIGFDLDRGFAVWVAATLAQVVGFLVQLEIGNAEQIPTGAPILIEGGDSRIQYWA